MGIATFILGLVGDLAQLGIEAALNAQKTTDELWVTLEEKLGTAIVTIQKNRAESAKGNNAVAAQLEEDRKRLANDDATPPDSPKLDPTLILNPKPRPE